MPWSANILAPPVGGAGSTCSPSRKLSTDPRSGAIRRHHLDEDVLQRAVKEAARGAGVRKPGMSFRLALDLGPYFKV